MMTLEEPVSVVLHLQTCNSVHAPVVCSLPAYSKRRGKSSSLENNNAFCRLPSPTTTTCSAGTVKPGSTLDVFQIDM